MNFRKIKEWLFYGVLALFILTTVISISRADEPELGKWRWSKDTLEPTDDKQVHAVGSFGLYYLFVNKGMTQNNAANSVFWFGLLKEGIDAFVPWEKYGRWGGDGFSKNDVVYNAIGIGSAYLIDRLWEKKSYENKSKYIEIHPGFIRFSIYLD
ncbi:MAG: hypothetical protein H8D94_01735 [Candidatus Pelagibacter sp.]|nr:hypothetical protein [Candidatus Pelagibacter sp.]